MTAKVCSSCKVSKPIGEFYRGSRSGRQSSCKECHKIRARERYRNNADVRAQAAARYQAKRDQLKTQAREDQRAIREAAIRIYGGTCQECGSTEDLQFDHVNGGGQSHRRTEDHHTYLRRIVRSGAPLVDVELQLLCRPCHSKKSAAERRALNAARRELRQR